MTNKLIETSHGRIEFSSIGKGIPILFIHGGHSNCNEKLCHKGFDLDKFQLITPSRPGYGRTPLNNNITPKHAADLVYRMLEHLSLDKVVVYGISAGGLTAIELASNYQNKVKKLILASAVSKKWLNEQSKKYKTAKRIFNPKIEKMTWGIVRFFAALMPRLMAKSFHQQFSKNPVQQFKKEDIKDLVLELRNYNSKLGFLNDIDQDINPKSIANIKCPTLIIHSDNDNSVPIEHAEYAHNLIANSKFEILKNEWGHLFWLGSDSRESIDKTIKFIKE